MDRGICKMHTHHLHVLRLQSSRQVAALLSNTLAICLLFLVFHPIVSHAQCNNTIGCFPPIGNLANGRTVQTDSDCSAGENFCLHGTTDCSNVCSPSTHSIASVNDGNTGTAWISTIGPNGTIATLQLNFEVPVLFDSMVMLWKSTRPRSMVLERSNDGGTTWEAYRFYSNSCQNDFAIMPETSFEFSSTDAICIGRESAVLPNTNAEVTFATSEHLPEGTSTAVSTAYRLITNLRVRLLGQFILGSDTGYQYYSVGEWVVSGSCMCNGHAAMCAPIPGETMATDKVYSGCMCEHSTEGTHCDSCQTGFNAVQWSPGTATDANACERCECNGHADDCTSANPEVGTQCIDCTDNTEGNNCQMCQIGYYQNPSVLFNDPNICIDCDCETAGITDSGECSEAGQCNCKSNVTGLRCSQCVDGYWNLTAGNEYGCQVCECDLRGTRQSSSSPALALCDQVTGLCQCRDNVGGDTCSICDDGYYSLEDRCLPCDCNIAASSSAVCDKDSPDGQCPCLPNVNSPTCTLPLPGHFFRYLDHELFEAEEAALSEGLTRVYPVPGSGVEYSGRGLVVFPLSGTVTFSVQVPRDYRYEIILRVQSPADVDGVFLFIESQSPVPQDLHCSPSSNTTTSSFILLPLSSSDAGYLVADTVCMVAGLVYTVHVEYTEFSAQTRGWMLDSLLLLPDFSSGSAYYTEQKATGDSSLLEPCLPRSVALGGVREECRDIVFALSVEFYGQVFECDCGSSAGADTSVTCALYGGQCSCLEGVTGLQCDVCINGRFNLSAIGCEACGCDAEGSTSAVCDINTGQCDCRPNVEGLTCGNCVWGYFNLTSTGCLDCNCSQFSTSIQCSELGQCPCTNGVGGAKCDQCLPEYYNITSSGCTPCNCSSVGTHSSSNNCDSVSGQCPCIGNTINRDCSECPARYFETNNPDADACVQCVCSARSDVCSDDSGNYQAAAIHSDFRQLCAQNPVACNDDWQLLTASGEMADPFGPSDASGLGYVILSNNNPMLYAPDKFLGNQQASYGLDFTVSVSLSNTTGLKTTTAVTLKSTLEDRTLTAVGVFPQAVQQESSFNTILTYTIPLMEDVWHVTSSTGQSATLYSVLSNLTQLSFSAEYRQDFIEFVYVQSVMLQTRVSLGTLATAALVLLDTSFPVELCVCPAEYTGSSCELCARGYARSNNDSCIECNCNNLSLDCNVETAVCSNCSGNSEGANCERCQSGYYGDPTRDIPCMPCLCPLLDRGFSPTCYLDFDLNATCDACSPGYTGRNCETCMDGFFGNPLIGWCTTCECHGNIDPALGPVCDTNIGRCLNCLNNTMGFNCESCLPGYYGDPPSGVPCRPCECHPNGTSGGCSSLFGTCVCANEDVLGDLCDECRDGYWGLSQGLPCVPCDCCSNGSNSQICNKETGQCDCHINVGSEEDDKCCTCTPGYFNFTPDGCQACGCSGLSVSEACDITSGRCQCQEGAIGLKCDDCAFGFFGTVPDCEQCHPCFSQWYDRIEDISGMVELLENRAQHLVQGNYNGYTVESIEADIQDLLDQLATANATLRNITLDSSSVQPLQYILSEINEAIAEMDELTRDTEQELTTAEQMLATTAAFNGTINQTSVNELVEMIAFYNTTIASNVSRAQELLNELLQDQTQAARDWEEINKLEVMVEELLTNASLAEADIDRVELLVGQFKTERAVLRMNLTNLSVAVYDLLSQLAGLNASKANASRDGSEAYTSVQELVLKLTTLRLQTDSVLNLTRQLNTSIETTRTASQELVKSISNIVDTLRATQQAAEEVSSNVAGGLDEVERLQTQLQMTKALAQQILNISLPSLEYVKELARSINASILPDVQVQQIVENATASNEAAQQALELAQNASEDVRVTQSLISELNSDLNTTRVTQGEVEMALTRLRENINNSTLELQQVRAGVEVVNSTFREVDSIVKDASSVVESASQYAMQLQNRSRQLKYQASVDEERSLMIANDANDIISEFSSLQEEVERRHNQSMQVLHDASYTLTSAQQLRNDTNQVTMQQLQDLLNEYISEKNAVDALRQEVQILEEEIRSLTLTFTQAAQTLSECYKTP